MADDLRSTPGASGEAAALLVNAVRCRRLAAQSLDLRTCEVLKALASECEAKAAEIQGRSRRRAA